MVEKIREVKDEVLERMERAIDERGGTDRMDVNEVGKLADIVKDLAEAEKSCWEAEYYMGVSEAMGEGPMGYWDGMDGSMGYPGQSGSGSRSNGSQGGSRGSRSGYRGQRRDSMGRYARRGYRYGHDDIVATVKDMMDTADPQMREQLKMQLREMLEM